MGQWLLNLYKSHKNIDNNWPNGKNRVNETYHNSDQYTNIHSNSAILVKDFGLYSSEKLLFQHFDKHFWNCPRFDLVRDIKIISGTCSHILRLQVLKGF